MKKWFKIAAVVIVATVIIAAIFWWRTEHLAKEPAPKTTTKQVESQPSKTKTTNKQAANPYGLVPPINDFRARITKKFFGTYVSPAHSPVQPERFEGYHDGVDVEYGDIKGDVPVHAITAGTVIYSNWVSGYGGVEILHHKIDGAIHSVLYGHLRPSSMLPVGTTVERNQQIGLLGTAYSHETDGERRNLHFDILAGSGINLRGYAQTKSALKNWLDPLKFYPS